MRGKKGETLFPLLSPKANARSKMKIREKRIFSGKILEAEFYPVTADGKLYTRGKKKEVSRESQQKLNDKNARKKLRRLIENNFEEENDYYCTFTYTNNEIPKTYEECKRDLTNFFRRMRRAREKENLPELKYIYAIEFTASKRTGIARFNIHMVINGGLPRKVVKKMWGKGEIKKVEELQAGEHGFERLANYMCKEWSNELLPKNRKRYTPSRNLKQPTEKRRDGVFKPRFLEKICKQRLDDRAYWENRYKGYSFVSAESEYNEDYGAWYLSVFLKKRE